MAINMIEEGSSVRSLVENGVSMTDHTSNVSSNKHRSIYGSNSNTEEKKVRHISRGRNAIQSVTV